MSLSERTLTGVSMGRIRSKISVVCDAGPIIHLDELDCLHLMEDFEKVFVPDIVRKEVLAYRGVTFEDSNVRWNGISHRFPMEAPLETMYRIFSLDAGEVAALAFMSEEPGLMFLTDDAAARVVATKLGYNVHGTIGILIRAVRRDLMKPQEVIGTLRRIPLKSTLHIKASLLEEVISSVKQEFNLK
jgi:predicted nucleic acid-binding protein